MTLGPEYDEVERPLIEQLKNMGWTHLEGAPPGTPAPTDPKKSGRTSFSEVILEDRLRSQLKHINRDNHGRPWLDDRRISQAVAALTRVSATSLLEANQKATDLLINGTTADGLPGWDGGRDQRIHYIDWANWDKPHANDCVDRTQLQGQLSEILQLTGETVDVKKKTRTAHAALAQHGPGIVCVMIQKQQDLDARKNKPADEAIIEGKAPPFPELNSDESIVLLIDEAHRSHTSTLHTNLMDALPNAARIGFTGTPILMGKKKWTTSTFGPYIDVYRLADAEKDKAVVPILYAGRRVKGAVRDGSDMDEVFESILEELTPREIEQIKRRYATRAEVMEAEELIAAKARNMLRHYTETVLPNGFKDPAKPPAFLIVKSMLLTGFDAPVEQVLYLDRSMKEAELLQAIARVNRPATGRNNALKQCGYVIDYVGVTDDLTKALKAYAAEDVEGILTNLETDQIHALRARLARVREVFTNRGVTPGTSEEAKEDCVRLLEDGPVRDRFETDLHLFLSTVDTVLPMPQAGQFVPAAKLFAEIAKRARRRYREDGDFDPSLYGEKVRELIDEHMTALGIDQILPPVSITDPEYLERAAKLSPRARASEMEHAIRNHIRLHMDEDPVRYRRLSERLEQILDEHRDNWAQQAFALSEFLDTIKDDFPRTPDGDSPAASRLESALYGLLAEETSTDGVITPERAEDLGRLTSALHDLAVKRTKRRDFWRHPAAQSDFTKEITVELITGGICPARDAPALADKLTAIVRAQGAYRQSQG